MEVTSSQTALAQEPAFMDPKPAQLTPATPSKPLITVSTAGVFIRLAPVPITLPETSVSELRRQIPY